MDQFERQLSQRLGIQSPDWRITPFDSLKTPKVGKIGHLGRMNQ